MWRIRWLEQVGAVAHVPQPLDARHVRRRPAARLPAAVADDEPVPAATADEAEPLNAQASPPTRSLNRIHTGDREQLQAEANKAMKKLGSSKDFLESHLMRASVLTPVEDDPPPGSNSRPRASGGPALATIVSGRMAAPAEAATANGGSGSAAAEEEEEQHAAGMGATAVSVVVRGNRVLVANTGPRSLLC